jgi:hypothetical protein
MLLPPQLGIIVTASLCITATNCRQSTNFSNSYCSIGYMRALCKVRGLTSSFLVGTSWRCGDGIFLEVPTLASDALLTTLHLLLEKVLQTVDHFEICLGAPFSWLKKPKNRMGRDLDCMADVLMGFHRSTFSKPNTSQFRSRPVRFLRFWK